MSDNQLITQLNNLLINLNKSLLQYAGEASLWTSIDADEEREVYHSLVARQKSNCEAILEIILDRRWNITQGTYPTEYTDLHYVAFDYLAKQIAQNEKDIIDSIQETLTVFAGDSEVESILNRTLQDTHDNIEQLNKITNAL